MSKKKKKFRSELNRIAQNMAKEQNVPETKVTQELAIHDQDSWSTDESNILFVRKEINRIILSLIICMALLITIWLLDIKTPYIANFSGWIAQNLNIK